MIELQNEFQNQSEINLALLERSILTALESVNKPDVDITLRLTDDATMRRLNQSFRDVDKTTDVLAFNQDFINPETERFYLGDIVISVERAIEQAPENNHTLDQECAFLAIHGTLHLLGYDHYENRQKAEMWDLQDKIYQQVITSFQKE